MMLYNTQNYWVFGLYVEFYSFQNKGRWTNSKFYVITSPIMLFRLGALMLLVAKKARESEPNCGYFGGRDVEGHLRVKGS
jgi:hypothetical protein